MKRRAAEKAGTLPPAPESWVSTPSTGSLSNRASRNTVPELLLRRALHGRGLRYRLHRKVGERMTADIVFPAARVAVFADGCYWHGCPRHPRTEPRGPNRDAWIAKFDRIGYRERRVAELLAECGFEVLRVWECEIRADPETVAARIEALVRRRVAGSWVGADARRGPSGRSTSVRAWTTRARSRSSPRPGRT